MPVVDVEVRSSESRIGSTCQFIEFPFCVLLLVDLVSLNILFSG